ncbi:putative RNA methyltransferase [uncultured Paraglaciecola sp.]|uniref:putative RNA methyltransferase n=1 Tax=uncultured Paraglaciecola sp. TaxID=1765024 RepID=UPI002598882C|nr:methyltransferase domain-containing protein [uncultured Paraglaciecola sp.]
MNNLLSPWICPSCQSPLFLNDNTLSCENKHSFDLAKEGYVNLLLAQNKNSKAPGDNKQMVSGRRAFLESGLYQPLAQTITGMFKLHLCPSESEENIKIFDAGCGEGYYLNWLAENLTMHIEEGALPILYSGIDISKFAIQKAAKQYKKQQYAVASTFNLPVPSASQDGVLQIFAPSSEQEIYRVLKDKGIWVVINPAGEHLQQFKYALYDSPTQHQAKTLEPEGFVLKQQFNLNFELELADKNQVENLLMMTPYYWSATEEKRQQLITYVREVTADFDIRVYVKQLV